MNQHTLVQLNNDDDATNSRARDLSNAGRLRACSETQLVSVDVCMKTFRPMRRWSGAVGFTRGVAMQANGG
jgi:hypothetical protein